MIRKWIKRLAIEAHTEVMVEVRKKQKEKSESEMIGVDRYTFDFSEIHTTKDILEVLKVLNSRMTINMNKDEYHSNPDNKKYLKRI